MSLKRLINPSITSNEKYINYNITSLSKNTVKDMLSNSFIDGVFGLEAFRVLDRKVSHSFLHQITKLIGVK